MTIFIVPVDVREIVSLLQGLIQVTVHVYTFTDGAEFVRFLSVGFLTAGATQMEQAA